MLAVGSLMFFETFESPTYFLKSILKWLMPAVVAHKSGTPFVRLLSRQNSTARLGAALEAQFMAWADANSKETLLTHNFCSELGKTMEDHSHGL